MTSATARANQRRRLIARTLPYDIKADIAAAARSLELVTGSAGGMCLWRSIVGQYALALSGIQSRITLGGMVYRVGPDERRDVMAFCGPGNAGMMTGAGMLAHYFLTTDGGEIVDFSVGDWKHGGIPDHPEDGGRLGSIQWSIEPPDFHWDVVSKFQRPAGSTLYTPEIGQAWYTGFRGDQFGIFEMIAAEIEDKGPLILGVLTHHIKRHNIIERIAAHRHAIPGMIKDAHGIGNCEDHYENLRV